MQGLCSLLHLFFYLYLFLIISDKAGSGETNFIMDLSEVVSHQLARRCESNDS